MTGGPCERPRPVVRSSGWPSVPVRLAAPGLAGALAAGRFEVAGFAAFDPARPSDPGVVAREPIEVDP